MRKYEIPTNRLVNEKDSNLSERLKRDCTIMVHLPEKKTGLTRLRRMKRPPCAFREAGACAGKATHMVANEAL